MLECLCESVRQGQEMRESDATFPASLAYPLLTLLIKIDASGTVGHQPHCSFCVYLSVGVCVESDTLKLLVA